MPNPRGKIMTTHCFVDTNHAADKVTRRSKNGILIFCNRAPILRFRKIQNSVQSSTFGSEFMALKNAVELFTALRYKLRMFGVPIDCPTDMFCDNKVVYKSSSTPESVLRKKHHSVAYHKWREVVTSEICRIAKENTETNLADIFTKLLPYPRRERLLDMFTYLKSPENQVIQDTYQKVLRYGLDVKNSLTSPKIWARCKRMAMSPESQVNHKQVPISSRAKGIHWNEYSSRGPSWYNG